MGKRIEISSDGWRIVHAFRSSKTSVVFRLEVFEAGRWVPVVDGHNKRHFDFLVSETCVGVPDRIFKQLRKLPDVPSRELAVKYEQANRDAAELRCVRNAGVSGAPAVERNGTYTEIFLADLPKEPRFFLSAAEYHGVIAAWVEPDGTPARLAVSPNGKRYHLQKLRDAGEWRGAGRGRLSRWLPELKGRLTPRKLKAIPDDPAKVARPWADEMAERSAALRAVAPTGETYGRVLASEKDWRLVVCPLGLEYLLQQKVDGQWIARRRGPERADIVQGVVADFDAGGVPSVSGWCLESPVIEAALEGLPMYAEEMGPVSL